MIKMRRHLFLAALTGLALRLFFVLRFPATAGDTGIYKELARNWLDHRVYGIVVGGLLTPVDLRAPGYPAFLVAVYALFGRKDTAILVAQAALDLATCFLVAALAAALAPRVTRRRVALAALWLAATCPFVANYAAVPLSEVLATFLTAAALLVLARAAPPEELAPDGVERPAFHSLRWLLAGLLVGLGTLVRPEAPLLLVAAALVLAVRWRQPANWPRLIRVVALLGAGLFLPLLPWAARNWRVLHRVQFLAPRYSNLPGEVVPRGFYAWTNTWLVRFRDVYLVPWKLEDEPIYIEDLPAAAFDSPQERERIAALLAQYNENGVISPELDQQFGELARERTARHPLRTYAWVPLDRVATLWFTPRIDLLPFSGHLWPLAQQWDDDRVDVCVTLGFFLLNGFYVALALWGARFVIRMGRKPPLPIAFFLLVTFIVVRTAFFTYVDTPEPRYVLVCFPALLALAAQTWGTPPG
jgi:4-amino-4-deoxy-L-arabinose transferase-like glycosyltransferase